MNRAVLKRIAAPVVVVVGLLALSTAIRDAASTLSLAPAPANDRPGAPAERASDKAHASAIEGNSASVPAREAHSDGGYWEWQERQAAEGSPVN